MKNKPVSNTNIFAKDSNFEAKCFYDYKKVQLEVWVLK